MDCFKVLGIEPTKDLKVIKRAYSKLLPTYPPETDPEGFQKLRAAYEEAAAKANEADLPAAEVSPVDAFMAGFEETYKSFEKRVDVDQWKKLLEQDICYNIETGNVISSRILGFIMDNYYFPHAVWRTFEGYFSWSTKKDRLYAQFPKNFIDFVIYKCSNDDLFRYHELTKCLEGSQDLFIAEYNKGCSAIDDYDLYTAKKSIKAAKDIYPSHPDLLILEARYFMLNGQMEEANSLLNAIIEQNDSDFNAHLYRGNLYFRMGSFKAAYRDYKMGYSIKADSYDLLFALGKCCTSLGEYEEAIEYLDKLKGMLQYNRDAWVLLNSAYSFFIDSLIERLSAEPEDAAIKYKLANAYINTSRAEESYEILCDMEQKKQTSKDMYVLMCRVQLALGKQELAFGTVNKALSEYPGDYDLIFYKASVLDELGRYEEAIKFYNEAIEVKSEDALAYNNKAYLLNKLERYNEALECANKSISLDGSMAHSYKNKAEALLGLELFEECLEACEEGLNIYMYLTEIYIIKMRLFTRIGRYEDTMSIYNKVMDLGLKDSRLHEERANALRYMERYDEAIDCCDQAIELDNGNADAYYCKGLCYYGKEAYDEAINCFDKTIEYNSTFEKAYYYKILCLKYSEKEKEALYEADRAINRRFVNADRFFELKGDILAKEKKYQEAILEYQKAIEHNPSIARYYYSAGTNLSNISEFEKSIEYFVKALELDPSMVNAYIDMSHSLYNQKEYLRCIEQCDAAIELDSNYLVAHQNRAWALYALGRKEEAERSCNNGLNIDSSYINLLYLKMLILKDAGSFKDALIVSDRILDIDPKDEDTIKMRAYLVKNDKSKGNFMDKLFGQKNR